MQIRTLRSQFSNIDMFSKLESSFLQKFFKYNLNDYSSVLINVYQDLFDKTLTKKPEPQQPQPTQSTKLQKSISSSLFLAQHKFTIEQFEQSTQNFYKERSPSISKKDLPYAFKLKYNNLKAVPSLIGPGELVFVDVKIKVDVQRIQELPQKIIKQFQHYRLPKKGKLTKLEQLLSSYRQQYFNIFIVYFGDSNFQIFNPKQYQTPSIKLMGNHFKLRIQTFYISKQAMLEAFKTMNRIENMECINDLVIQFYQLKREKERRRRVKRNGAGSGKRGNMSNRSSKGEGRDAGDGRESEGETYKEKLYMFIGVFGLVGFGFAIRKLLL